MLYDKLLCSAAWDTLEAMPLPTLVFKYLNLKTYHTLVLINDVCRKDNSSLPLNPLYIPDRYCY
jgi:hypothetical protein